MPSFPDNTTSDNTTSDRWTPTDGSVALGLDGNSTAEAEAVRSLYAAAVPAMLVACALSAALNVAIVACVRGATPTLALSVSLAAADAFASGVIGVGLVVNSLLPAVYGVDMGPYQACYLLVLEAFRLGGMVVSVLHLLALAVNHYVGISRPLHYASTVTRGAVCRAVAAMWVAPVAFFLAYFALVPEDGFRSHRCLRYDFLVRLPFRLTVSALFFAPLLLMSAMYTHMFVIIRRHRKALLHGLQANAGLRTNVKAVVTTLLILGTYVLGWMPAVLYFALTCLDCPLPFDRIRWRVRLPLGVFTNSMIVAKSLVDPVVYVVRMPEIRAALLRVLRCGGRTHPQAGLHGSRLSTVASTSVRTDLNGCEKTRFEMAD